MLLFRRFTFAGVGSTMIPGSEWPDFSKCSNIFLLGDAGCAGGEHVVLSSTTRKKKKRGSRRLAGEYAGPNRKIKMARSSDRDFRDEDNCKALPSHLLVHPPLTSSAWRLGLHARALRAADALFSISFLASSDEPLTTTLFDTL
jgi:hypothetical protein